MTTQHSDDIAVDAFAAALKAKMAKQRAKGYGGWDDKNDCSTERLQKLLVDHIAKGDPVDVGNFAMMLWNRGEATAAPLPAPQAQPLTGWQPIETAPKETEVFIGRYIDGVFKFGRSEMFYEQANEFAGETFSGWVWSEDYCDSSVTENTTHWMPLPPAPGEAAPAPQGEKQC